MRTKLVTGAARCTRTRRGPDDVRGKLEGRTSDDGKGRWGEDVL